MFQKWCYCYSINYYRSWVSLCSVFITCSSLIPITNSLARTLKQLCTKVTIGGLTCWMLCKRACLFMEMNNFSVSTSKTASVSFVANMSCIEYTAASHLVSCPPHSCRFPTVFVTSAFTHGSFPCFSTNHFRKTTSASSWNSFSYCKHVQWNQRLPYQDRISKYQINLMFTVFPTHHWSPITVQHLI